MSEGWWFLIVLVLFGALGLILRSKYLAEGTPFRTWFEKHWRARAEKVVGAFFLLTVVVWLAIWATASDEDRARLPQELKAFLKSIEWAKPDNLVKKLEEKKKQVEQEMDGEEQKAGPTAPGPASQPAEESGY